MHLMTDLKTGRYIENSRRVERSPAPTKSKVGASKSFDVGDVKVANVHEMAGYCGCGGHYWAYQVGA